MAKLVINDSTLTAIGNAIREKTGKTDLIAPGAMPAEIAAIETGGGGGGEVEPIVLSGSCGYVGSGFLASAYMDSFGDSISTKDITNTENMFNLCAATNIPFEINCKAGSNVGMKNMFLNASSLESIPKINGKPKPTTMEGIFQNCYNLYRLPEDLEEWFDWSAIENSTSQYSNTRGGRTFSGCYSLRFVPMGFLNHDNPKVTTTSGGYNMYYDLFYNCYVLDELVGLPIPNAETATKTSNMFDSTFNNCYRLKEMTFATQEDGTPYTVNWKNQTITLSTKVGSSLNELGGRSSILNNNSGITADKEVTDDASYQALKNDPDWFAISVRYSRYNHDSAVNTINSLPDTSAYLATAYGTNTIKFYGEAGELTDGGAINTLTEEEIAVAAAKGWTVTLV